MIRSFGVSYPRGGTLLPPRSPAWHQLIYATRGVVAVRTKEAAWVAPPHRAVWVPSSVEFQLQLTGAVALRSLYLARSRRVAMPRTCAVVNVTPLLRELIVRTVELSTLDATQPYQRRLAQLIFDELALLQSVPLQLPLPSEPRALRFAEALPQTHTDVKKLLRRCGVSRRTLERLFTAETGMSLGQWMRRERLLRALPRLAAGETVNAVASDLGYSSASAFIAMFRRELGETPGHYFYT